MGLVAVAGLAYSLVCAAPPTMFVVQIQTPFESGSNPNVQLTPFVVEELNDDGRVNVIAWSLADPIFRAAVEEGMVQGEIGAPTVPEARRLASRLRARYLMIYTAVRHEETVHAEVQVFDGTRQIWRFPETRDSISIEKQLELARNRQENSVEIRPGQRTTTFMTSGGFQDENLLRSLAHTWVAMLNHGPFRDLPPRPKVIDPGPDPAVRPVEIDVIPDRRSPTDPALVEAARRLMAQGRTSAALQSYRDAVDEAPWDLDRRLELIRALVQAGMPDVAGQEAIRAATVLPDRIELRLEAARAYLRSGRNDLALTEVHEVLARNPASVDARILRGDMALMEGRFEIAIEHYSQAGGEVPDLEGIYRRGVAHAIQGARPLAAADFDRSRAGLAADETSVARRYEDLVNIVDLRLLDLSHDIRSLIQRARVRRLDPEVGRLANLYAATVENLRFVYAELRAPENSQANHDRRKLAATLFLQSTQEIQNYVKTDDEDLLSDANINLAEATQLLEVLRNNERLARTSPPGS